MLRRMPLAEASLPLSDVCILEVGDESAAYGTRFLADLGADVIMVEPPEDGPIRNLAPFVDDRPGPNSSYEHLFLNINKRSVRIDLDSNAGRERFLNLLATADVLIDSGPAEPLPEGLSDAVLRTVRPDLVRVSIRPYGLDGPWRNRTGSHLTALASGGLLSITGHLDDPPTQGPVDCAFKLSGHSAATAVFLGLHERAKSGRGTHFSISGQEAVTMSITQTANPNQLLLTDTVPARPGLSQAVECSDGGWAAQNIRPDRFAQFLTMITDAGVVHDFGPDDWIRSREGPNPLDNPVGDLARQYGKLVPRDEFVTTMRAAGSLAMPNYDLNDVLNEPHYEETNQFLELEDAAPGTTLSIPASPARDFGERVEMRPASLLGESDAMLEGLARAIRTAPTALADDPSKLLESIRVVELSWVLAGPIGGCILADFGAEVIRIESRVRPDALRNYLMPDGSRNPDLLGLYNCVNTGKKSLTLDLTTDRGKATLLDLTATADVVIDNYSMDGLKRMGLDFETLSERNPGLSMVHMPGCGTKGRWSTERTMGNLLMASSGINSLMGFDGREPRGVGIAFPDFIAPHVMASMAIAAIRMRDKHGKGRELTIDQLGATVALLGAQWMRFRHTGEQPPRPGNRSANHCPHGVYPCSGNDRWIAIAARNQSHWDSIVEAMGQPDLLDDQRFATFEDRKRHEDELNDIIAAWTADQDRWQLANRLQEAGVPAAAVEDLRDLVEQDPQLAGHYQRVRQPSAPDFEIIVDAEAIRLLGCDHTMSRAPGLGEHNEDVLRGILHMSMEQFDSLVVEGVIN